MAAEPATTMPGGRIGYADIARVDYFSKAGLEDWRAAMGSVRAYEANIKSDPKMSPGLKAGQAAPTGGAAVGLRNGARR